MSIRRPHKREGWNETQIRAAVDHVMQHAGNFASFHTFFDALLLANDNLPHTVLAESIKKNTGKHITAQTIRAMREDEHAPTYEFIETLLQHNLLHLDPQKIGPGGEHRQILFECAGFTEVTPESIAAHNEKILKNHRIQNTLGNVAFGTLMREMISIHLQGDRAHLEEMPGFHVFHRSRDILANLGHPSAEERQLFYDYCQLSDGQQKEIEDAIAMGTIRFGKQSEKTPFSSQLDSIVGRIKSNGLRAQDICEHSKDGDGNGIAQGELSSLRAGKYPPTAAKLRAIIRGIEWCRKERQFAVAEDAVERLISASPIPKDLLYATSHECIARANGETSIKALLLQIREAVDIGVQRPRLVELNDTPHSGGIHINSSGMLLNWETPGLPAPNDAQTRGLMTRYNYFLRQQGKPELTGEEIDKVAAIAERDFTAWQETPHKEKVRLSAFRSNGRHAHGA